MIIGSIFDGDDDVGLMRFQHDFYYEMLGRWIDMAGIRRFQYREIPEWDEICRKWDIFRKEAVFDHRTIQLHHDLIAARFRQNMRDNPFRTTLETRSMGWRQFFCKEAVGWLEDGHCLRLFMTTLACANTKEGYAGEGALAEVMRNKYNL
jgi:hypothetical protein